MRFSERIGKKEIKAEIQLDSMDEALRNGLWNILCIYIINKMCESTWLRSSGYQPLVENIWFSFFKEPIDNISPFPESIAKEIRMRFFVWHYLEVYDFIDFIASEPGLPFNQNKFISDCNFILKRELSAYRFVEKKLAPITNDLEINSIESALKSTESKDLKGVRIHLAEALSKLSDKKNPDYRNSIKESISAVESICQEITGEQSAELGKTLKKLKSKLPIHGALEQGFIKIYGYTSDGDGIRHAMMDETNLDQEDALYMLVSCSSFINYLITKSDKIGLNK